MFLHGTPPDFRRSIAWLSFAGQRSLIDTIPLQSVCGFRAVHLLLATRFAIITLAVLSICNLGSHGEERKPAVCTEDAMIVFDASGSMSGDGWGYGSESANTVSRIDLARQYPGMIGGEDAVSVALADSGVTDPQQLRRRTLENFDFKPPH
jgi:hypothetical protein